jgi:hypothetical protein
MTAKEYKKIAYGEWFDWVDPMVAKRAHARNVQREGKRPLDFRRYRGT